MRIDSFGCIVMEKDGFPGDLGDSCAETSRYVVLTTRPLVPDLLELNLWAFVTPTGFVRHPNAPESAPGTGANWREPDFTSDQALPLLMAASLTNDTLFAVIYGKLRGMGYRTAPSKIAAIGVICAMNDWLFCLSLTLVIQSFIFKFPWRWKDTGGFERSSGSAADWLNYVVTFQYLCKRGIVWPLKYLDREKAKEMVSLYYSNQPNSDWVVEKYKAMI